MGTGLVEGKVALVTGAASGIGRAAALALSREGARVVVSDVQIEPGEATAKTIRGEGGDARFVEADVAAEDEVEGLIRFVVETYGRLDCALNNAGIAGRAAPVHELLLDEWSRTLAVNLTGVFLCMKYEIPVMLHQGGGSIVNTSSAAGVIAAPGLAPYCASKHGILGLTKTVAIENAQTGIRVNAICPGSTDTPMLRGFMESSPEAEKLVLSRQPGGRLATPEEIAEAAVWLCSDRASFVTGHALLVDGGAIAT